MRTLLSLLALASFPSVTLAQSVHVVDDDGGAGVFTTIQSAIDVALPGDIVLVREGSYDAFTLSKALVIHGDEDGARPVVAGPVGVTGTTAADQVALRHLEVSGVPLALPTAPVLSVTACAGPVWVEDVVTNKTMLTVVETGVRVTDSTSVVFARCELRGDSDPFLFGTTAGLYVTASTVQVYDSRLIGGSVVGQGSGGNPGTGVPGLLVDNGTVFVSGSTIRGGDGLDGGDDFLCSVCNGGDGGDGVRVLGGDSSVEFVDSQVLPGQGGAPDDPNTGFCVFTGCQSGSPGVESDIQDGVVFGTPGIARSMDSVSPVRDGEDVIDTFVGEPGDFVVLAFSLSQVPGVQLVDVIGPGFIGNPAFLSGQGFLDATGEKVRVVPTGGLISGFAAVPVYKQAIVIDATPQFRISSPSLLLLLDPAF